MKGRIVNCAVAFTLGSLISGTTVFAAQAPQKPDKNVVGYVKTINQSVKDLDSFLSQLNVTLAHVQNMQSVDQDYHTLDTSANRLNSDLKTIKVNMSYNKFMAGNQWHMERLFPEISGDMELIDADLTTGDGTVLKPDCVSLIHHVHQAKAYYYVDYYEMMHYGIKPSLIQIPTTIQTRINNIPDTFLEAYVPPTQGLTPGFTYDNFSAIDSSFSVTDVDTLFGLEGTLDSEAGAGTDYDLQTYSWQSGNASVTVTFANGMETAKDQIGLN